MKLKTSNIEYSSNIGDKKYRMKFIKIFALIFFFFSCEINSQNQSVKKEKEVAVKTDQTISKIAYVNLDKSRYFTDRIDFKSTNGKVISSFDIQSNNPFNKLDLPDKGFNTFGGKVYPLKEISPQRYQKILGLSSNAHNNNLNFVAAESQATVYQKSLNHALVVYNLFLFDGFGETFEAESEIILLNSVGKEIQRLRLPHIVRVPLVTNNGKYFFANYGGTYSCSNFEYTPQEFKVYDISRGKMIYKESREGKESLNPIVLEENRIAYPYYGGSVDIYKIYDLEKEVVYSREFTPVELGFSSFVKGGMKVKMNNDFVVLGYENDFDKTPLNLTK